MVQVRAVVATLLAVELLLPALPAAAIEGGNDDRATSFEVFPYPSSVPGVYQAFPYSAVGRIYFNSGTECSASMITSPGKSYIVTAAHCLYNRTTAQWSTNVTFVPERYQGQEPVGRWYVRLNGPPGRHDGFLKVPSEYLNGMNNYDFGFAVLSTQGGLYAQDILGSLGAFFSDATATASRLHSVLGFPSGQELNGCVSPRIGQYSFPSGPPHVALACNRLTSGSSGGPRYEPV